MTDTKNMVEALINQVQTYPDLTLQDMFKFIYQSCFGCEHLLSDVSTVTERIRKEAENVCPHIGEWIEPLYGNYCRVYLDYINEGLSAETLGKLFFLSATHEDMGEANMREMLSLLLELAERGKLPYACEEAASAAKEWENTSFAACHHSEQFRALYAPAYRVIKKEYASYLPLLVQIDRMIKDRKVSAKGENAKADFNTKNRFILAIDGKSASGKTSLANLLKEVYGCTVFHMDDFFLRSEQRTKERLTEPGGNVDRERFLSEVLLALRESEQISYRPYDCGSQTLLNPILVTPTDFCVVEGAYSMHPDLVGYYDYSVYMDIQTGEQKRRILERNTKEMAERFFLTWIPLEETYFKTFKIREKCSMVLHTGNKKTQYEVSDQTIENVAILAKLSLSEEEKQQAKRDMGKMISMMDKLNELNTDGVEPMSHIFPVKNVFREDVVTNGDGSADTLSNAPATKDGGILVPHTLS